MELIDRQHQLEDEIHQTISKEPNCECIGLMVDLVPPISLLFNVTLVLSSLVKVDPNFFLF